MRRVLMVCYYFPPLGGIGSIRALKFATYLPEFEWYPTVLAPRTGTYHRDAALHFPEQRVVRSPSIELSRLGKAVVGLDAGSAAPARLGGARGRLRSFVRRWLYRPDGQVGWYPGAVRAGRSAFLQTRFDAIFSSSFPITAHLVAMRLQRDFRVPWVAEFRDLWTDLAHYDSALRRHLDRRLERRILLSAGELVTVSPTWSAMLEARAARRVCTITNGFDPEDGCDEPAPRRPVVAYLGSFYPATQDLRTPLLALGRLARAGELDGLVVRIVGELSQALRELVSEAGLTQSLEATGFVSHREALRQIRTSALLLLAGVRSAGTPAAFKGQIAAKVFEYLASRRPILYVGDPDADMANLLRGFAGVGIVPSGDVDGASRVITGLLRGGPEVEREALAPYTHRTLAGKLAGLLSQAQA